MPQSKVKDFIWVISTVIMLILVVYLYPINERIKKIEDCHTKQHEQFSNIEKCVEVNKVTQDGENKIIKLELENLNRKLDAIIDAINSKNGFLICDPIITDKKRANE